MLSPNGIKAILFDLDGTLRQNQPDGAEVFIGQAIALGLPVSAEDRLRGIRWEHYYWADSPELHADLKTYEREGPEFWRNYGRRQLVSLGIDRKQAEQLAPVLAEYMDEQYKPESVLPNEVPAMLGELKKAGFKLGVVSNRLNPYHEELDRLGLASHFDLVMAAGEVQVYKPDPGIFLAALERVGLEPGAAMYVGDNYFADVVGAQRAGLRPVLYDPRGVYPHASCEVISSFDQLPKLFEKAGSPSRG
jgi:HAD superfamily hydrolase (TIGR01662 family)